MSNQDKLKKLCSVHGCELIKVAKNFCHTHYKRFKKHGDPTKKIENKKKLDFDADSNGCFNITSHFKDKDGYGKLYLNNKHQRAHRVVYEQMFGEIPKGLVVRHKCDNPSCVNPEHLELGTNQDNIKDKVRRNRTAKGTKINTSKLQEEDVLKIRKEIEKGIPISEIAKVYSVSVSTIYRIKKREIWCFL